jgi:HPt (histidine-containing phosphotransfer) domain-containing protein
MAAFDLERLLESVGGDRAFAVELVRSFLDEYPERLARIRSALGCSEGGEIADQAHTLRGAAVHLSAGEVAASAQRLEASARRGEFDAAGTACRELERDLAELRPLLEALL